MAAVAVSVGCQRNAPAELTEAMMHALVEGYGEAIENNHLDLALWYVHSESPSRTVLAGELSDQLASYQERARITRLENNTVEGGPATATVDQNFILIFGLKFIRQSRRRVFEFRSEGDSWRIWAISGQTSGQ